MNTEQEIFDAAYKGIKSQGWKQSKDALGNYCNYRGENGMKCAIGWCIPDNKYNSEFDKGVMSIRDIIHIVGIPSEHTRFCIDLQRVHDRSSNPEIMKTRLHEFAQNNKLTIPK